jgi:hypothetical protein
MSPKVHLFIDTIALVVFLVVFEPVVTGLAIHEWLALAFAGVLIVHILSHWDWVVSVTTSFFKKLSLSSRLNYLINALLFIGFTVAVFSGLMISEAVLPFLGLKSGHAPVWRPLHDLSADVTLILVGLHFALHWHWIANTVWHVVFAPIWRLFGNHKLEPSRAGVKRDLGSTREQE